MTNWKRNIAFFITGQTISLIGSLLVQYAIMWYITLTTQSGVMMTISILCGFVPGLLLAPFAGVWADRFDRKKLIILADAFIAILTLITALVFLLGYREIWLLFVVSVFRSLGQAVHQPSVGAVYPQIVPQDKLMRVQGISSGIQSAMMVIAPIAGASLLTFASLEVIFSIDFFTAALAISSLLLFVTIPKPEKRPKGEKVDYLLDMKMGLKYIKSHHFLIPFFTYIALVLFFVAPAAFLTPLQVVRRFGDEVWRLSAIEITFSAGMTVGGLIIAAWGGFKNRIVTMVFALSFLGLSTMLFGIVGNFWVYLGVMVFMGLNLPFYNTPAIVMIQEKVEPEYMGRVMSVLGMINGAAMPLGMLVFGPLADYIAIEWLMVISGLVMLLIGLSILMNRGLMRAGESRKTIDTLKVEVVPTLSE
ncbi:MAG: MFS transporter [Tenericutes bacterium HGW-Tenericutes-1]|nr:MAG: MFS transporter [Tenericutes bacterium HGW-Tenericutes-1]